MSKKLQGIEKDAQQLSGFVLIYCEAHHSTKGSLCPDCQNLLDYAIQRRKLCPLDPKPDCKHCHIHCYKPEQREKIRQVMRYSGPRFYKLFGKQD